VQAQIERKEGMQPLDRSLDCVSRSVKESGGEKVTIRRPPRSIAIGVAVVVALMVADFPAEAGLPSWLERQQEAVRQARDEAGAAS
jgi:hypothetical protein